MSLRDILVHLDDPATSAPALTAAIALAKRHGAHLTGIHVYNFDLPLMMLSGGYIDPKTLDSFLEEGRRAIDEKRGAVQAMFEDMLRQAGLEADWRPVEGDIEGQLTLHARYADLIVFGRPPETDTTLVAMAETVMFGSGRPVLLVPPVPLTAAIGDRILIGWNGTREAAPRGGRCLAAAAAGGGGAHPECCPARAGGAGWQPSPRFRPGAALGPP
jgi:nucleotide-binding universal stress UspA family protein